MEGHQSDLPQGWQASASFTEEGVLRLSPGRLRTSRKNRTRKGILCQENGLCQGTEA